MSKKNKIIHVPKSVTMESKHVIRIFEKRNQKTEELSNVTREFILPAEEFLSELSRIKRIVMILYDFTSKNLRDTKEQLNQLINSSDSTDNGDYREIKVSKEEHKIFRSLMKKSRLLKGSPSMILENFLISIFSQYENFLSNQIKLIFNKYPDKLGSDKKLEYSDFVKLDSIEKIQDYYIENEIRGIIGLKTFEQIKIIESKLLDYKEYKILQSNLPLIGLVELSSRRNLYVHNEGKIHEQYINNCKEVGKIISREEIGKNLDIDIDYFNYAFEVIYESTLIISYLVGRKIYHSDDDLESLEGYFNNNCFDLIDSDFESSVDLPIRLLEFVLNKKNKLSHKAIDTFVYSINLAICYKIKSDTDKMCAVLDEQDFSACDNRFKFADLVLREKYEDAIKIMELVSLTEEKSNLMKAKDLLPDGFDEDDYHEFPLFYKIKKEPLFLAKYKEIFGKDYNDEEYYW